MSEVTLVLDTHVWIWMVEGLRDSLSTKAAEAVERASASGGLSISAISVWEVAMLESKGRLTLSRPIETWVADASRAPGLRVAELSTDIAIASTRLPGEPHGDPADRMIIATARAMGAALVTADRDIVRYGAAGHVQIVDAAP